MHEMSVIVPIIRIGSKLAQQNHMKRVICVRLAVGEIHDLDEKWAFKYYDRYSKGTPLEGSTLKIRHIPICFRCKECGNEAAYNHFNFVQVNLADMTCSRCGCREHEMISGDELLIEGIEHL